MSRLYNKKWLAVYGAVLAIVLIMAVMVVSFHRSQVALRASYLDSFRRDLALRATMVGLFYEHLETGLREMTHSPRVRSYFGNRALGMSMEYGLAVSLDQVGRYFDQELAGKRAGGSPVWRRLMLLDGHGRVLIARQSEIPSLGPLPVMGLPSPVDLPPQGSMGSRPLVLSGGPQAEVLLSAPCFYRGHRVGRLVGWANPDAVCANFAQSERPAGASHVVVAAKVGDRLQPVGCAYSLSLQLLPRLMGRSLDQPHLLPAPKGAQDQGEFLAMGQQVKDTPFIIYSLLPARLWLGDISPWQLSLALGLTALLLMVGLALLVWSNYRDAVLAVRLDQEEVDRQEVERSYRQLSQEMAVRERAERALRVSEEHFRAVFDNASQGIAVIDRKGRFQQVNPTWRELFGYTSGQTEGMTWHEVTHPHDLAAIQEEFDRLARGETGRFSREGRALRSDGQVIWVDLAVSAVRGPGGELGKTVAVVADIGRRMRALEALKSSEEKFIKAFQSSPDSVMITRLSDGVFLEVNDSSLNIVGRGREQTLGRSVNELGIWADPATHRRFVKSLRENGECLDLAAEFRAKDGHLFPVLISGRVMELDGEQVVVAVVKDMTESKLAEEALALSEQRYRSLVENVPYGIFIADHPTGKLMFVNQAICDLFGYTMAEGLDLAIWQVVDSRDHERIRERMRARAAGHRLPVEHDIYTGVRKDGTTFRCEVSVSRVSYRGQPALQGILRDVTEKEILERQLQHAQKMEALGTLAGGVAHEFNNILMTFRGYIQLLQMRPDLGSEVQQSLLKMEKSTRRAGELTQKMLTFSRLESGEKVPVQINRVINDAEGLLRQTFPPSIALNFDLAPELPLVLANPNHLEQVLVNLALNARDAMPGGGNLHIVTRQTMLNAEFVSAHPWAKEGPYVTVRVADDGPGIPPAELERIFEPFYTTKEPGRGTGLGLAVAYSMIKNHGGGIVAANRPDGGGQFEIYLPVNESMPPLPRQSPVQEPAPQGGGQRILVVDDEEAVRDICRQALEAFGYEVGLAGDGAEALRLYEQAGRDGQPFELVLLDLAMPRMDGLACARALLEMDPEARIVIATGHGGDRYQVADLYPQAKGVLQKPFDLNTLLRQVSRVLAE